MESSESLEDTLLSQLDWKSHEILQALADAGGQATTTEIRKRTHIDNNDHITHRYRRASVALEPTGLIEVRDSEPSSNQRNPTYEVTLTEKGEAAAERLSERDGNADSLSLDERVEKVETALATLEATVEELQTEVDLMEGSSGADLDTRVEAIEERLDHVTDAELGAWSPAQQKEHQMAVWGTRAVRDFLLEEYGEQFKRHLETHVEN